MKILYAITKGTWGGAQTHVYDLVKDQVERKNDVFLVVGESGKLIKNIEKNFPQVKVFKVNTLTNELKIKNIFLTIRRMRQILKKVNPDIIHLHSTVAGTLGRIAAIGLNKKIIFTVHGSSFTPGLSKKRQMIAQKVEKLLVPITDRFIFVSNFDANLWNQKISNFKKSGKGIVIYNGVADTLNKDAKRNVNNTKTLEICMAARFSPPKRQELLIKSLVHSSLLNKIHVTFLGSGELEKKCRDIANNNPAFSFKGAVNNVTEYYKNADIIALITNFEGLPISLVEALPLAKPIVASNVGGIPEIVNRKNGFVVNNDEQEIQIAITKLINNDLRQELGQNSRKRYEEKFMIQKMLDATNNIYIQLLGD